MNGTVLWDQVKGDPVLADLSDIDEWSECSLLERLLLLKVCGSDLVR